MNNVEQLIDRMKLAETERMKDVYEGCAETGLPKRFADTFYFRITEFPLKQTKSVIAAKGDVASLKLYLQIMLDKRPNDPKAEEWRQSLTLIKIQKVT